MQKMNTAQLSSDAFKDIIGGVKFNKMFNYAFKVFTLTKEANLIELNDSSFT